MFILCIQCIVVNNVVFNFRVASVSGAGGQAPVPQHLPQVNITKYSVHVPQSCTCTIIVHDYTVHVHV